MSSGLISRDKLPVRRDPLEPEARKSVLSTFRLKLVLGAFITLVLLCLAGVQLWLIDGVFARVEPGIRADLGRAVERVLREVADTTEVGLVFGEPAMLAKAIAPYRADEDVVAVIVTDGNGRVVYEHGVSPVPAPELFAGSQGVVRTLGNHLAAWAPSGDTGAGRVAVVVSTERLRLADELRAVQSQVLGLTAIAVAIALLIALAFVGLYLGPIIRMTKAAFHELEVMTERALESARLKSQFLAVMSHEIRTPMNAILGMSELLVGAELPPAQRRQAEVVHGSAEALLEIINDILDFSKLDAGKLTLHSEPFDLAELVEDVAVLAATRAESKGLEVLVELPAAVPERVVGDAARLRQVLVNLAINAVKFTERGHVLLRIAQGERRLRFEISDTGVGISEADQKLLFTAFTQVDGSLTRAQGGTGLGLAISKRLVEQMGGKIALTSSPGNGSTFAFELKLLADKTSRRRPAYPLRALVVDDHPLGRKLLRDRLFDLGLDVETAADAAEALALLQAAKRPFDVALVDLEMPGTSGLELARRVRASPAIAQTKLLLLCPLSGGVDEATARDLVDATVTKPVRGRSMEAALARVAAGQDAWGASGVWRIPSISDADAPVTPQPVAAPPPAQTGRVARILLVDDNPVNQEVAAAALHKLGYDCDVAVSGEDAIHATSEHTYDLIFMDCQMPGMDGYAATARIRRAEVEGQRTPIVAMTAQTHTRDRMTAAGMDDYLPKPFRVEELKRMLEKWLPLKEARAPADNGSSAASRPATAETEGAALLALDPEAYRPAPIIKVFLTHAPGHLQAVRDAAAARDATDLGNTAHRLKGSLLAMGANGLAGLCRDIEKAARVGELDRAEQALVKLAGAFDGVCAALEREAAAAPPDAP